MIPQAVTDLALSQQGDGLILHWSNPTATLDGDPIKAISEVEVWMMDEKKGEGRREKIASSEFEKKAKLLARIEKKDFHSSLEKPGASSDLTFIYPLEKGQIGNTVLTFALRVKDERGRLSPFSEPLSLEAMALPLPPQKVLASLFEDRVEIRWESPEKNIDGSTPPRATGYNIYRAEDKEPFSLLNPELVKGREYQDKNFSFGRTYRYIVRASASGTSPYSESEDSDIVEVQTRDVFPPAPPSGLTAIVGADYIVLSWEANKETDCAGYRVWRRQEEQLDFVLLKPLGIAENSYTDSAVEKNKRYVYAISALDMTGNESQKSAPETAIIREKPR